MYNIHARVYFGKFTAQKKKIRLEPSNQTVPESNKNATQKIYKNEQTQSLAGANRLVMQTMDFLNALYFG